MFKHFLAPENAGTMFRMAAIPKCLWNQSWKFYISITSWLFYCLASMVVIPPTEIIALIKQWTWCVMTTMPSMLHSQALWKVQWVEKTKQVISTMGSNSSVRVRKDKVSAQYQNKFMEIHSYCRNIKWWTSQLNPPAACQLLLSAKIKLNGHVCSVFWRIPYKSSEIFATTDKKDV